MEENEEPLPDLSPDDEPEEMGWGDLPRMVNIRDFAQMVGNEFEQIGSSFRLSLRSMFQLPFGPVTGTIGFLLTWVRACLLILVIFVFGSGILLITLLRALGLFSPKRDDGADE